MKQKIKLFSKGSQNDIEDEVNEFLNTLKAENVIDIKLSSTADTFDIMVIYQVKVN